LWAAPWHGWGVKNVSDDLADALRGRAKRNHRSIQGERMAILEESLTARPFRAFALLDRIRAMGLETPDEAAGMLRRERDAR